MVEVTHVPFGKSGKQNGDEPAPDNSIIKPVPIGTEWISHSWFVALVRPTRLVPRQRREDVLALEAMQALGIPAWYATGKRHVKGSRGRVDCNGNKTRMLSYLMFPGYMFIAHDGDSAKFSRCLSVRHIDRILGHDIGCGFVPVRVPGHAMQALFAGEEIRQCNNALESEPLKQGESVSIIDGPFAQFDGEVTKLINANRIEVLLKILGSQRPVEIPVDNLKRL